VTPSPARSRPGAHRRPAQRPPRRVSGPARPAPRPATAPAGAGTLPRRGATTAFERLRALPDHRIVDRLLRSRLWIILIGGLLGGIVAMQVSLLKLNSGISRAVETSATLERQNGELEAAIARLGATERVRSTALSRGMVLPPAGEVEFLRSRRGDAARAAAKLQPPSEEAQTLLANGGIVPGLLPAAAVDPSAATTAVDPAATTTTVDPAATATTVDPAATATTATTVDPAATATTATTVDPAATTTTVDPAPTTATTTTTTEPAATTATATTTLDPAAPTTTADPAATTTTTTTVPGQE
jgi:hypothetical protein